MAAIKEAFEKHMTTDTRLKFLGQARTGAICGRRSEGAHLKRGTHLRGARASG